MTEEVIVVGAGPYGLSVAAHLRRSAIPHRIFGPTMDTWISHMPKGMLLKSDGFASDLYDPDGAFTLRHFCAEQGIPYAPMGVPVRLETFITYGRAFQKRMVPDLEQSRVSRIERISGRFEVRLDTGENCLSRRLVLAVGITYFEHVPEKLAHLPESLLTHSAQHRDVERFRGRNVAVIGGGASALDLAGLLHKAGAHVQLIARKTGLKFHSKPTGKPRPLWQRLRHPDSGLGPGLRSRFFASAPWAFHYLPEKLRREAVRRTLGPSGGYFTRELIIDKVPLLLGYTLENAVAEGESVRLLLQAMDGSTKEIVTEHVIAATGYQVNLEKLDFMSRELRSQIRTTAGSPVLSSHFETSVPGLYMVGIAAANSFGPAMRFAFGARFAARQLTKALHRSATNDVSPAPVEQLAASAK
jgi:thioredoxin reductase